LSIEIATQKFKCIYLSRYNIPPVPFFLLLYTGSLTNVSSTNGFEFSWRLHLCKQVVVARDASMTCKRYRRYGIATVNFRQRLTHSEGCSPQRSNESKRIIVQGTDAAFLLLFEGADSAALCSLAVQLWHPKLKLEPIGTP